MLPRSMQHVPVGACPFERRNGSICLRSAVGYACMRPGRHLQCPHCTPPPSHTHTHLPACPPTLPSPSHPPGPLLGHCCPIRSIGHCSRGAPALRTRQPATSGWPTCRRSCCGRPRPTGYCRRRDGPSSRCGTHTRGGGGRIQGGQERGGGRPHLYGTLICELRCPCMALVASLTAAALRRLEPLPPPTPSRCPWALPWLRGLASPLPPPLRRTSRCCSAWCWCWPAASARPSSPSTRY